MSGGSWDYLYFRIDEAGRELQGSSDVLRKAFGAHLLKVADAMHDIEWVDSADYRKGEEHAAIVAAIKFPHIIEARRQNLIDTARSVLDAELAVIEAAKAEAATLKDWRFGDTVLFYYQEKLIEAVDALIKAELSLDERIQLDEISPDARRKYDMYRRIHTPRVAWDLAANPRNYPA